MRRWPNHLVSGHPLVGYNKAERQPQDLGGLGLALTSYNNQTDPLDLRCHNNNNNNMKRETPIGARPEYTSHKTRPRDLESLGYAQSEHQSNQATSTNQIQPWIQNQIDPTRIPKHIFIKNL